VKLKATIAVYALCAGEFLWRFLIHRPLAKHTQHLTIGVPAAKSMTKRQKILIAGVVFKLLCPLIRCVVHL
jgi:hypothetical protein